MSEKAKRTVCAEKLKRSAHLLLAISRTPNVITYSSAARLVSRDAASGSFG
jgi:hypothetical protein